MYDTRRIYSSFVALRTRRWRREHLWIVGLVTSDHVVSTLIQRVEGIIRVRTKGTAQCIVRGQSICRPLADTGSLGQRTTLLKSGKCWRGIKMRRRMSRMSCEWCFAC